MEGNDMEPRPNEIWHRPEFQDRLDELINNGEAAARAKVHFVTLASWKQRYTDFPKTVLTFTDKPTQMIHEGEFREWHQRYLETRGQKGRSNLVAPTNRRQRSEPEQRAHLADLREKREAFQDRLNRLDDRIAKEETLLSDIHAHQEQTLRDAIELISQIDADHRDQVVEAVLHRAEQQWRPADEASVNDPVAVAFPPDAPLPASTDPSEHHQDTPVLGAETESATHLQR